MVIALLTLNFRCYKDVAYMDNTRYAFKIPVDITPQKRTYTLADTVWLEADVTGKALYDTMSARNVTVDTSYLSVNVYYIQMAATTTNPADGLCQILSPTTNTVTRQLYKGAASASLYQYGCGQASFRWKLGFKPNYRGTYAIPIDRGGTMGFCGTVRDYFDAFYNFQYKPANLNKEAYEALPDSMRRKESYNATYFADGFAKGTIFMVKVE